MSRPLLVRVSLIGLALLYACGGSGSENNPDAGGLPDGAIQLEDGAIVYPADGATDDGDMSSPDAATSADSGIPFPVNDAGQVLCGDVPCKCSDGIDNDEDGLTDLEDPECVASWDNDESSFATGIPGDNRDDACQDCFFDGNSGSGDDGCYVPSSCITKGDNSSGRGRCNRCEQTDQCKSSCRALTPNGCDCFGCCTVTLANQSTVNIMLGNGCNIDGNTVEGCSSCVPNDSCRNTCGRCELCPGKTLADLPADCGGGGSTPPDASVPPPAYTCDDGEQVCGAGLPSCPANYACEFGCCVRLPVIIY